MQTVAGYYHYDLLQYFKELYIITFPLVISFTLLAFFVQTVVSNKFMGHAIVIGIFVFDPIMFRFGIENTLLLPGQNTPYTYSDMNGYGHFVPGALVVHRVLDGDLRRARPASPSRWPGAAPRTAGVPACCSSVRGCHA